MKPSRSSWFIDSVLIFACAAALILPFFSVEYLDRWSTIESHFMAEARLLKAEFPHYFWTASSYCGTRADYLYPPGLMGFIALVSHFGGVSIARAYHLCVSTFYCLGPVGVYLLVRTGNPSRVWAWIAALATVLLSPSLPFIQDFRPYSLTNAPQHLLVLAIYGEGPHISSLAILSFALAAAVCVFRGGGWPWMAVTALASALVVSLNFYGAVSLAIFFPLLAASFWAVRRQWDIPWCSAAIALLAYGLTAWWLVPSYFQVTAHNLGLVAAPGNTWSVALLAVVLAGYGFLLWRVMRRPAPAADDGTRDYRFFIYSGIFFIALYVLGHRAFGFQVVGASDRLVPELDLFMILAGVEGLRTLWNFRDGKVGALRVAIVAALLVILGSTYPFVSRVHEAFPPDMSWRRTTEFKTQNWLHRHFPDQRVMVTGTHRFWYNVWQDGPQMNGTSDQGILNPNIPGAVWQLRQNDPEMIRLWLHAMAVDIAVIPGEKSEEHYGDIKSPEIWDQTFPLLRDDGDGNRYYRIPRPSTGIVQIVPAGFAVGLPPMSHTRDWLESYVRAVEGQASPNQATVRPARPGNSRMVLDAQLAPGEALLVRETYDPNWRAREHGREIRIERDPLSFMLIKAPPGTHHIELTFQEPLERRIGFWISMASITGVGVIFAGATRRRYFPKSRGP